MKMIQDKSGRRKRFITVKKNVVDNVVNSMSKTELANHYVDKLSEEEFLQWATNADGNFGS